VAGAVPLLALCLRPPPPKAFGDYAAEQIAQQVARGVAAIVTHVKSVAAGAVDPDNVTSLSVARVEDRRRPGVEQ
jgi:hypothetical protein